MEDEKHAQLLARYYNMHLTNRVSYAGRLHGVKKRKIQGKE